MMCFFNKKNKHAMCTLRVCWAVSFNSYHVQPHAFNLFKSSRDSNNKAYFYLTHIVSPRDGGSIITDTEPSKLIPPTRAADGEFDRDTNGEFI
jgi:hypothetical protein